MLQVFCFFTQRLQVMVSLLRYSQYANLKILLIISLFFIYIKELIFTAWISDDAMITFRVVLNFIHGYGARFNIIERVQAYTHPLWFGLLSLFSFITRDVFLSTYILSFTLSIINFLFILIIARGFTTRVLVLLFLIFSKAFVDYSTSGLENPLSHFFVLLFFIYVKNFFIKNEKESLVKIFLTTSFLYLTRPDLIVFTLGVLLFITFSFKENKIYLLKSCLIGFLPAILWTLFSLWYYGFPFPNTAYAKLQLNIPKNEIFYQGFLYLVHTLYRDPITIFCIGLGLFLGIFSLKVHKLLSIGILLQVFYVIYVGGDFMEGRFLTPIFFLSVILISQIPLEKNFQPFILAIVITLGIYGSRNTIFTNEKYDNKKIYESGIADERGYYFQDTGLLNTQNLNSQTKNWTSSKQQVMYTCGSLGAEGILRGANTHIIDFCGLADPLLARLPLGKNSNWKEAYVFHKLPFWYEYLVSKKDPNWRIGHFVRNIPMGYIESLVKDKNVIHDAEIKEFYNLILEITRGPLWSLERLKLIVNINTGKIKPPSHNYEYYEIQKEKLEIWDIE